MTPRSGLKAALLLLSASLSSTALAQAQRAQEVSGPASAGTKNPDARARATEKAMTEEERYRYLDSPMALDLPGLAQVPEGAHPAVGYVPPIPRLGLPALYETDASLGVTNPSEVRKGDWSTALPASISLASTFSPELAERGGAVVGQEARAKGFNIVLGGGSNLIREPRNGRNFEYLSEDPLLTGLMAAGSIRGIQSQKVVSTVKHMALNAQETLRMTLDAHIAEPALRESDLLAFQIAIERSAPGAVMCGYNLVNGQYDCENEFLLNTVLKEDWGYKGWVMSDWGAVHSLQSVVNGMDQQSGSQLDPDVYVGAPLREAVAEGRIPKARVSEAVRRILRSVYAVGADAPFTSEPAPIDYAAHAKVAREAGTAGIVLLKNAEDILPLAASAKSIAVIGGHADMGVMTGGGSSQVTPEGEVATLPIGGRESWGGWAKAVYFPSSPLKALKEALPDTQVEFDSGYYHQSAASFAARKEIAIVFVTAWSGEALDGSLTLPEGQDALIEAVAAANPNTVVVIQSGNPIKMPWLDKVKGVIEAWYPGQEGGAAIADILTGKANPSGHLPVTFPRDESQLVRPEIPGLGEPEGTRLVVEYTEGADVGYRWYAAKDLSPLFPFGHGLSYTRFAHEDLRVNAAPGNAPTASVSVRNTGAKAGTDVVQLYLTSGPKGATRRLVGFQRVDLAPGEARKVEITLDPRLLANWQDGAFVQAAGRYTFAAGHSAQDLGAPVKVTLKERSFGR
ncbi:beta-glucosidase family protein [Novosphingobium profundi]|uniref:beta-glucosidase family protein n=1 Tax=Novosphingobium profundi TaxID=1774954 RepID=UPI001CFD1BD8|nr:glycoside hydrolase family 3 C-terminal domain-containing protein [Novosphingobium profundi]